MSRHNMNANLSILFDLCLLSPIKTQIAPCEKRSMQLWPIRIYSRASRKLSHCSTSHLLEVESAAATQSSMHSLKSRGSTRIDRML